MTSSTYTFASTPTRGAAAHRTDAVDALQHALALLFIPNTGTLSIPLTAPVPVDVVLQAFGYGAPLPSGKSPANFSNPVFFRIE